MRHLSALILTLFFSGVSHAYVLGGTIPGKWGDPSIGTGAAVTWSLTGTGVSCGQEYIGCTATALADFMPPGFEAELARAFDAWSAVADLTFTQVTDGGEPFNFPVDNSGDIRVSGHLITGASGITEPDMHGHPVLDGASGVLAHGFFPPQNGETAAGDIHFDTEDSWGIGFGAPGVDIFQVFVHELGHALGLGHTAVANSLMNPIYSEAFSGPQADDIAGMQFLYGPAAVNSVPAPQVWLLLIVGLMGFSLANTKRQFQV